MYSQINKGSILMPFLLMCITCFASSNTLLPEDVASSMLEFDL